jgi:hypothetical protein
VVRTVENRFKTTRQERASLRVFHNVPSGTFEAFGDIIPAPASFPLAGAGHCIDRSSFPGRLKSQRDVPAGTIWQASTRKVAIFLQEHPQLFSTDVSSNTLLALRCVMFPQEPDLPCCYSLHTSRRDSGERALASALHLPARERK